MCGFPHIVPSHSLVCWACSRHVIACVVRRVVAAIVHVVGDVVVQTADQPAIEREPEDGGEEALCGAVDRFDRACVAELGHQASMPQNQAVGTSARGRQRPERTAEDAHLVGVVARSLRLVLTRVGDGRLQQRGSRPAVSAEQRCQSSPAGTIGAVSCAGARPVGDSTTTSSRPMGRMRDTIVSIIGTSRESRKGKWPSASRIGGLMSTSSPEGPTLERRFGLLQATALNMTNMIGVGPFITIPLLMSALGGPQAMLGWLVALVIVICRRDGVERAGRGDARLGRNAIVYLREGIRSAKLGRLMAFLFIWQFMLSGPLEIASGYIGFSKYASYIWPGLTRRRAPSRSSPSIGVAEHRAALPPHRRRSARSRWRSGWAR